MWPFKSEAEKPTSEPEPKLVPHRWHWRNPNSGWSCYEGRYEQTDEIEPLIVAIMEMRDQLREGTPSKRDKAFGMVLDLLHGKMNDMASMLDYYYDRFVGEKGPRRTGGYGLVSMTKVESYQTAQMEAVKQLHRDHERRFCRNFGIEYDSRHAHCVFCEDEGSTSGPLRSAKRTEAK